MTPHTKTWRDYQKDEKEYEKDIVIKQLCFVLCVIGVLLFMKGLDLMYIALY